MYLYETHMHTSPVSACAHVTPIEQIHIYKSRGYTGVIITDHFLNGNTSCPRDWPWQKRIEYFSSGYETAKAESVKHGLDVFFGWEFCCTDGTEFLTYGLDIAFLLAHPGMDMLSIEDYSSLVRENGGYLAQAHPYRVGAWIQKQSPVDHCLIDGIEVLNASMPDSVNQKASDFARQHGLPIQAGSDSHRSTLTDYSGIKLSQRAENIHDIIKAIKLKSVELITP